MRYNIHYDICAFFIALFIILCVFLEKGIKKISNKIFFVVIISNLISVIFDILSAISNSEGYNFPYWIRDILSYVFLIAHNTMPFTFALYVLFLMGIYHKKKKGFYIIFSIPFGISLFLLLFNSLFHWVFYYNDSGVYSHGIMIYMLYFNAFIYMTVATIFIICLRNTITKKRYYALLTFIVCSVVPIVIQMFFPHLLIELFFQSLGILGLLWTIENKDEIYNSITKIYNRFAFLTDTTTAMMNHISFDVLTVKIPNTSYFNTTLGVNYMNGIMTSIARWLEQLNPSVHVYDCEKGHFSLLIFKEPKAEVDRMIADIAERFRGEWIFDDIRIAFPVQICIAKIPDDIKNIEHMMLIIDTPYISKDNNSEIIYTNEFNAYQREIDVEHAMEKAIKNRTFQVYYQPIWDRKANKVHSAEALLRLFDDQLGYISPDEFIPIAEKNGAIIDIGAFVLEEVCKLFYENDMESMGISFIEVNLSIVQCMNKKLVGNFKDIIKKYNIEASKINLEITESAAMNSQRALLNMMEELQEVGFTFSLDDYGTGYSNFVHIFNMPFQIVKLDKTILWSAEENENARNLLVNTVKMIKEMNIKVVVEGVETEMQKALLEELECDYMQGFYFSKPVDKESFIEYCRKHNKL